MFLVSLTQGPKMPSGCFKLVGSFSHHSLTSSRWGITPELVLCASPFSESANQMASSYSHITSHKS